MKVELNITYGQVILALGVLCIGVLLGYGLPRTSEVNQCSDYNGFTQSDLNILGQASYITGHCERLGLISNVMIQDYNGIKYGVPVCVERKATE